MESTLKIGSKGEEVKKLQKLLNHKLKPVPLIKEDGDFGEITYRLIKIFQAVNFIGIDGVVGPKTWNVLLGRAKSTKLPVADMPGNTKALWLDFAKKETNQKEIKGPIHNPRIIAYHSTTSLRADKDETPWCSSFVNWALKQAGITGTNSAAAISWMSWGKPSSAQAGAITVIYNSKAANTGLTSSGNHVGFLIQETSTHFILLGGNQSDQVKTSLYPKSAWKLKGYRWPNI